MSEEKTEIEAVIRALGDAFNARDPKAFALLFTEAAEYVSIFGTRIRGRAAIQAAHTVIFSSFPSGTRFVLRGIDTKLLTARIAICHVPWAREKEATTPKGGLAAGTGIFTMVLSKPDSQWLLEAATNVQDAPMPGKGSGLLSG